MTLTGNIMINIFSVLILIILFFHSLLYTQRQLLSARLYNCILIITTFLLIADIFSRFDGNPASGYPILNRAGNFLVFFACLILPSLWLLYAHDQVFHDVNRLKRLIPPLIAINAANVVLLVISQSTGWYYSIDADNVYHRGPLFWLPVAVTMMLLLIVFIMVWLNRKSLDRKHFYPLILFIVPPLAGIVIQMIFYGLSIMLNSVMLSLLIVFLNIQGKDAFTDYLTGVNNRKRLDLYLMDKIRTSSPRSTFSAILLDIDHFKAINDTFGHNVGDEALEAAASLLGKCLRASDFIARFGGDEFLIVLDIADHKELEQTVERIRLRVDQYNQAGGRPFELGFSMGYAVYDGSARPGLAVFLKELDRLMYEDKRRLKPAASPD